MTSNATGATPVVDAPIHHVESLESLVWTVHPARRSPARLAAVIATSAMAAALSGFIAGSAPVAVAAFVLLVLSLRRFYFPTTTRLDDEGISIRCLGIETRRRWDRFRRFRYDDGGAFLSRQIRSSRLDGFTGLHLTWGDERESAIGFIERRISAANQRFS